MATAPPFDPNSDLQSLRSGKLTPGGQPTPSAHDPSADLQALRAGKLGTPPAPVSPSAPAAASPVPVLPPVTQQTAPPVPVPQPGTPPPGTLQGPPGVQPAPTPRTPGGEPLPTGAPTGHDLRRMTGLLGQDIVPAPQEAAPSPAKTAAAPAAPQRPGMGDLRRAESGLSSGLQYPEEVGAEKPGVVGAFIDRMVNTLAGHFLGKALDFIPYSELFRRDPRDEGAAAALRAGLMEAHHYPALPEPAADPRVRKQQIAEKNQVIDLLQTLGSEVTDSGTLRPLRPEEPDQRGLLGQPREFLSPGQARQQVAQLTPWQKQLLPIVRQQLLAEQKINNAIANPKLLQALLVDTPSMLAGVGAHNWARRALVQRFGPVLERPVLQALLSGAAPLREVAARGAAAVATGSVAGAAAGGVGGGTSALVQGQRLPQAAGALLTGAISGAKIGGLFSALGFGAEVARSASFREYTPAQAEALSGQAEAAARARGYPEEEVAGLRTRTRDYFSAPAWMRAGLARQIAARLRFLETRNVTPEADLYRRALPPEEAGAVTPAPRPVAPERVGPQIQGPDGTAISLRHRTPAEIQQIGTAAAAAGHADVAARANQWLALHQAHAAHQHPALPPEQYSDYVNARAKPGGKEMAVARALRNTAGKFQAEDPDLAEKLLAAADHAEGDFQRAWHAKEVKSIATTEAPPVAPPLASTWDRLSPEQRAKLPVGARQALAVQAISNSLQVEDPQHPGIHRLSEVPSPVARQSQKALEKFADTLFGKAQATLAARHPEPAGIAVPPAAAAPVEAPGPTPAPTLVEPPTETVQPAEAQPAPMSVPEPERAPVPPAAAPAATPAMAQSPKKAGGVTAFGREWGRDKGAAEPAAPEPRAPHTMTKAEFALQHGDPRLVFDPDTNPLALPRVAESGIPGIHLEQTQEPGTVSERHVLVYRDAAGKTRGMLAFTALGEGKGDRRAAITGLYVDPALRGQGIGSALHDELAKAGYEPRPLGQRKMTPAGAALYHARAVRQALAEGQTVSPAVLKDYPKLAAGTGPAAAASNRGAMGRETAFRAGETTVQGRWAVVDVGSLHTSHTDPLTENPNYPAELQPRDRTRIASREQVADLERKLDPELMAENPLAQHGAPIVGPDGVVESGNARTIALRRAYAHGGEAATRYAAWLEENAGRFGLEPRAVAAMRQPALVRVRTTAMSTGERVAFTQAANARETAAMGAAETARMDAGRIGPKMWLFAPSADGNLNAAGNREFVRQFIAEMPTAEHASMRTADGGLSQEGLRRIQNAVFASVYGDSGALARLAEATDAPTRNITQGLLRGAGPLAELHARIAAGTAYPVAIGPDIAAAADKLAVLRDQGTSIEDYLAQQQLFEADLHPFQKQILEDLHAARRSSKRVAVLLSDYADLARKAGDPSTGSLFAGIAVPTKEELWTAAARRVQGMGEDEPELFAEKQPGATAGGPPVERPAGGAASESPAGRAGGGAGPGTGAAGEPTAPARPASRARRGGTAAAGGGEPAPAAGAGRAGAAGRAGTGAAATPEAGAEGATPGAGVGEKPGNVTRPHQMSRAAFEATGTPLLHGTQRAFDRFDPEAKAVNQARTKGHFFTDKPQVADTFAYHGGGTEEISDESISEALGRGRGLGNLPDIVPEIGERPLTVSDLRKIAAARIAEGRKVYVYDQDGNLQPLESPRKITAADLESGLKVYKKGREPRVIETTVYGPTLDLRRAKDWPADLVERLKASGNMFDQALFRQHEESARPHRADDRVGNVWTPLPLSPTIHAYATEQGIGKIRLNDAWESGFDSFYVPDLNYVGYNRDPHREFVQESLQRGEPVPAAVLRDYPDLAPPPGTEAAAAPEAGATKAGPGSVARLQPDLPPGHDYIEPQIGSPRLDYGDRVKIVNGGPIDGYITRIVKPGIRTVDEVVRPAEVETQSERPTPPGFRSGIYRPLASSKNKPTAPAPAGFTNPAFEQWRGDNTAQIETPPPESKLTRLGHQLTRRRENMPADAYHEPLSNRLDRLQHLPQLVRQRANFLLAEPTKDLTPEERAKFNAWLLHANWTENAVKGIPNPPDIEAEGPAALAREGTALLDWLADHPKVQNALTVWRRNLDGAASEYSKSKTDIGQREPGFTKEDWYHQEFLAPAMETARLAAEGAKAAGGRKQVKAVLHPDFTMQRHGGVNYHADPIQAHFNALADMIAATERNKIVKLLQTAEEKGGYNAMPRFKAQQAFGKDPAARQWLADLEGTNGQAVIVREMPQSVGQLAVAGMLPDEGSGKWQHVIDALAQNHALNEQRPPGSPPAEIDPELTGDLRDYARWIREIYTPPGGGGKAEAARYPEGYTPYKFMDGNALYQARSIPQKLAQALIDGVVDELAVTRADLRPILAVGKSPDALLLRNTVHRTVSDLVPEKPGLLDQTFRKVVRGSKMLGILNPEHTPALLKEHLIGSTITTLRANPKIWKELPQAILDLGDARLGNQIPAKDYQEFLFEGAGRDFHVTIGNAGEDAGLNYLSQLVQDHRGQPEKIWDGFQRLVLAGRVPVGRLDEAARYAIYRTTAAEIDRSGGVEKYLSARPDLAEAIGKVNGRNALAYYLSDQLMGAYGDLPQMLRQVSNVFPSAYTGFLFGKAKSETGLMANNIWRQPAIRRELAARLGGKTRAESGTAWGSGSVAAEGAARFMGPLLLLSAALTANNLLRFGKEEDEMGRQGPHLDLVRFPDGRLAQWDRVGALPGVVSLLGMDDAWGHLRDVLNGNMTPREAWRDIGRDGAASLISLSAQAKVPFEVAAMRRAGGGPIRSRTEYAADRLHVGEFYRAVEKLAGKPVPTPPARERLVATLLGAHLVNPAEEAYYQSTFNARGWINNQKQIPADQKQDSSWTPLQSALYGYRKSLQLGDTDSAMKYVAAIAKARLQQVMAQPKLAQAGTKALNDPVHRAIERMEPLYGLPSAQVPRYLRSLTPRERTQLRAGYGYWSGFATPTVPLPRGLALESYIAAVRKQVKAGIEREVPISAWARQHPVDVRQIGQQVRKEAAAARDWQHGGVPAVPIR